MENINLLSESGQPVPDESPTVSLSSLFDLMVVLETEIGALSSPTRLFGVEFARGLREELGATDGH